MFTHFEPIKVMPPPLFYAGWTLFSGSVMSSCVERWDNHRQLAVGKKKTYSLHLENIVILITKRYEHSPSNSNGNNWLDHTIQCGFLCISVCGGYSSPLTHYVYALWTMPPPLFSTNWTLFSGSAMSSCVEWWNNHWLLTSCQDEEIIFLAFKEYYYPQNKKVWVISIKLTQTTIFWLERVKVLMPFSSWTEGHQTSFDQKIVKPIPLLLQVTSGHFRSCVQLTVIS